MRSLEFCLPEDVPKEVGFYNKPTTQLDVGQAGKVGFLGINLEYQNLPTGDILIRDDILIERKTARDLLTSIIDQRLFALRTKN